MACVHGGLWARYGRRWGICPAFCHLSHVSGEAGAPAASASAGGLARSSVAGLSRAGAAESVYALRRLDEPMPLVQELQHRLAALEIIPTRRELDTLARTLDRHAEH